MEYKVTRVVDKIIYIYIYISIQTVSIDNQELV